jgi:hypothetical protein
LKLYLATASLSGCLRWMCWWCCLILVSVDTSVCLLEIWLGSRPIHLIMCLHQGAEDDLHVGRVVTSHLLASYPNPPYLHNTDFCGALFLDCRGSEDGGSKFLQNVISIYPMRLSYPKRLLSSNSWPAVCLYPCLS